MAIPTTRKGNDRQPVRILIVEDNAGDVYLLEKSLKNRCLSYELIRYTDGEEAIRVLQKDDCAIPDLVLLDLNLPRRQQTEYSPADKRRKIMATGTPVNYRLNHRHLVVDDVPKTVAFYEGTPGAKKV
jgi:DNA-binding NtrC family response regulator